LAFPSRAEEEARKEAGDALCAQIMHATIAAATANDWRAKYPRYVAIDETECRRRLRKFSRRLRDRMVAARMSLGFFSEAITGRPAVLPASMARHSLHELSKLVLEQSGEKYSQNVRRRAWRGSRSVIHLAAAMQVLARASEPGPEPFGYQLHDMNTHRRVIELAEVHERIVLTNQNFRLCRAELIRVRLLQDAA